MDGSFLFPGNKPGYFVRGFPFKETSTAGPLALHIASVSMRNNAASNLRDDRTQKRIFRGEFSRRIVAILSSRTYGEHCRAETRDVNRERYLIILSRVEDVSY